MENTPNLINLPVCLSGNPISQSLYKLLKQEVAICDLTKSIAVTFIIRYMRTFFENHEANWSGTKSNNYKQGKNDEGIPH